MALLAAAKPPAYAVLRSAFSSMATSALSCRSVSGSAAAAASAPIRLVAICKGVHRVAM